MKRNPLGFRSAADLEFSLDRCRRWLAAISFRRDRGSFVLMIHLCDSPIANCAADLH
jgi:hypothetical protein